MEAIAFTAALGIALSGGSGKVAPTVLLGTWKVQLSQDVRDSARKMGMPEPTAQFVFSSDKTYAYNSNFGTIAKTTSGTYEISEHAVRLFAQNNSWPSGIVGELKDENSLDVDGLHYLKAASTSLVGMWNLCTSDGHDKAVHMVFDKSGKFSFEGLFATSKGQYTTDGITVTLTWTEIDGGPVDPGTVHKTIPLNPDGTLQIDSFRYQKQ